MAAVTAESAGPDSVQPRVAVVVEGRPWSHEPVALAWHWVQSVEAVWELDPNASPAAQGAEPVLDVPSGGGWQLGLVASHEGAEHRSIVSVPTAEGVTPLAIAVEALPWDFESITGPELQREERQAATSAPAEFIEAGGFGRLTLSLAESADDTVVRWMGTGGSFFELDSLIADWAAGDLLLDDDEVVEPREALAPGPITVLGLTVTAGAPSRYVARDVYVGAPGPGLWVRERWIPTPEVIPVAADTAVQGTLIADDAAPSGLRLTDPTTASAASIVDWGEASARCGQKNEPFDPGWLLQQRCSVNQLNGASVVIVPEATP